MYWEQHERAIGFDVLVDGVFVPNNTYRALSASARGITKLQPHQRLHRAHHQKAAAAKQGLQLVHGNSGKKEGGTSQLFPATLAATTTGAKPTKFDFSSKIARAANGSAPIFGRSGSEMSSSSNLNVNAPSFESPIGSSFSTVTPGVESPSKEFGKFNNRNAATLPTFGGSASLAHTPGSFNVNARPYSPGVFTARPNDEQSSASKFRLRSRSPVKRGSSSPNKSHIPNLAYHSKTSSLGSQDARFIHSPFGMQSGLPGFGDAPSLQRELNTAMFQNSPHQHTTSRFFGNEFVGNTNNFSAGSSFSAQQQSQTPYYQGANYGSGSNLFQFGTRGGMISGLQMTKEQNPPNLHQQFHDHQQQLEHIRQVYPSQTVSQAINAAASGIHPPGLHFPYGRDQDFNVHGGID